MAKFKEKPRMSSTAGIGQNFRKVEVTNSNNSKKIIFLVVSILIAILFLSYLFTDNETPIDYHQTTTADYYNNDNLTSSDGNQYSIFKIRLNNELQKRIYVEQNTMNRSLNSLLDKISRDKMAKTSLNKPLFKKDELFFAITAAMFDNDNLPPGLLISNSQKYKNLNLSDGDGNFYLKPNGVLSVSNDGSVKIQESFKFDQTNSYAFALQSGPMLVIENTINNAFPNDSKNLNIRTAVGLTKDELIFVISKSKVNFFQLAEFMKIDMKCENALHLESAGFAFIDYPGSSFKNTFKTDTELRNLIVIR